MTQKPVAPKPSYSTTKFQLRLSSVMAWVVIVLCAVGALLGRAEAVSFGSIAVPSMAALIAAMLGIHRFSGSMDFRSSNLPRDQPEAEP